MRLLIVMKYKSRGCDFHLKLRESEVGCMVIHYLAQHIIKLYLKLKNSEISLNIFKNVTDIDLLIKIFIFCSVFF